MNIHRKNQSVNNYKSAYSTRKLEVFLPKTAFAYLDICIKHQKWHDSQ